jgi:hypothetical protein
MAKYFQQQLKGIPMLRYVCSVLFLGAFTINTLSSHGQNVLGQQHDTVEIWGDAANGLKPGLIIQKNGTEWGVDIDYLAQTNFSGVAWLMITNRVGSKPRLWLTNGMELQSTNPSVLAAMNLPSQTTVSNIMRGVRSQWRPGQWLRGSQAGLSSGDNISATTFSLQSAFGISLTNDYVLQVTPLLYKVETNRETTRLVEFPPIKVKLLSSGDVEQIK